MANLLTASTSPTATVTLDTEVGAEAPILFIDDSRVAQHLASRLIPGGTGRAVVCAGNGDLGLALVDQTRPSVVVADLQTPGKNGVELVRAIRSAHPEVPVVLVTASGSEALAVRALAEGAAGYIAKEDLASDLVATIRPLLAMVADNRRRPPLLLRQRSLARWFELQSDPRLLPPLVDMIREDFDAFGLGDETAGFRLGVALREALLNALYHGNLECGTSPRRADQESLSGLIAERRAAESYRSRRLQIASTVNRREARIVIRDGGPGFDTSCLGKPLGSDDFRDGAGRGLVLIRAFMDRISWNRAGNEITLIKRKSKVRR